jgi:hypothetical protein
MTEAKQGFALTVEFSELMLSVLRTSWDRAYGHLLYPADDESGQDLAVAEVMAGFLFRANFYIQTKLRELVDCGRSSTKVVEPAFLDGLLWATWQCLRSSSPSTTASPDSNGSNPPFPHSSLGHDFPRHNTGVVLSQTTSKSQNHCSIPETHLSPELTS